MDHFVFHKFSLPNLQKNDNLNGKDHVTTPTKTTVKGGRIVFACKLLFSVNYAYVDESLTQPQIYAIYPSIIIITFFVSVTFTYFNH